MGLLSYKINNSYAYFTNSVKGNSVIEMTYTKSNLDTSGANAPLLSDNMIPVYYDEASSAWKKADTTNTSKNYKWYDYNNKIWANAVTVTSANRNTYLSAKAGIEISMNDILTMQVWIPRYKYKIWNYNDDGTKTSNPQEIDITFETETSTTGDITCTNTLSGNSDEPSETCKLDNQINCTNDLCNNKTYTHPSFTFKDKELTGIWVGKYETTGTIDKITVKPNLNSLVSETISVFETKAMEMNNSGNIYGFLSTDIPHIAKNIDWGAVTYLSHSKYGRCTDETCSQTEANNCTSQITGYGPSSSCIDNANKYNGDKGKLASTTGNVYGVYDMSGGTNEYVMANVVAQGGHYMTPGSSGFGNTYPDAKYYDKYNYSTTSTSRTRGKLGDATKEVLYTTYNNGTSWYNSDLYIPFSGYPWPTRGGAYYDESSNKLLSIFSSSFNKGTSYSNVSFRLVITQ